jgi:hypothetical protein
MMSDPNLYVTLAASGLAGLGMLVYATLSGFRSWLALKQQELGRIAAPEMPSAGARIEIADLKERIRKLEAIAAGVEL